MLIPRVSIIFFYGCLMVHSLSSAAIPPLSTDARLLDLSSSPDCTKVFVSVGPPRGPSINLLYFADSSSWKILTDRAQNDFKMLSFGTQRNVIGVRGGTEIVQISLENSSYKVLYSDAVPVYYPTLGTTSIFFSTDSDTADPSPGLARFRVLKELDLQSRKVRRLLPEIAAYRFGRPHVTQPGLIFMDIVYPFNPQWDSATKIAFRKSYISTYGTNFIYRVRMEEVKTGRIAMNVLPQFLLDRSLQSAEYSSITDDAAIALFTRLSKTGRRWVAISADGAEIFSHVSSGRDLAVIGASGKCIVLADVHQGNLVARTLDLATKSWGEGKLGNSASPETLMLLEK